MTAAILQFQRATAPAKVRHDAFLSAVVEHHGHGSRAHDAAIRMAGRMFEQETRAEREAYESLRGLDASLDKIRKTGEFA